MKYKGELEGFPEEIVEKMLERQVEQGNVRDVSVFEKRKSQPKKGFWFDESIEGWCFWHIIVNKKQFEVFFNKYPKKNNMKKSDLKTGMIINTVSKGYCLIFGNAVVAMDTSNGSTPLSDYSKDLVFDSLNKSWNIVEVYSEPSNASGAELTWWCRNIPKLLKCCTLLYTETPIETIKIGDAVYNKEEFEEATKDLKPIK